MKNKRHALEREFRVESRTQSTAPSSRSNVDIAEQQMKQLESLREKGTHETFQDRVTTVASETRLAEEVKWRNVLKLQV